MMVHRAGVLFLITTVCFCGTPLRANGASDTVEALMKQRIKASDLRATGRLVVVNGQLRTTYKFKAKAHWFPDGLKALYEFSSADGAKEHLLLRMNAQGHLVADRSQSTLLNSLSHNANQQQRGLFGTMVATEDLVDSQFFWAAQQISGTSIFAGRSCTTMTSTPTLAESSRYASVTSCIDAERAYPLHVTKTLRSSHTQEEFSYGGFKRSGDVWIATQVELKVSGEVGSTLLLIDGGSTKARLGPSDFNVSHAGEGKEP